MLHHVLHNALAKKKKDIRTVKQKYWQEHIFKYAGVNGKSIVCNAEFNSVDTLSTTHPLCNVGMYLQSTPYPATGSCKTL